MIRRLTLLMSLLLLATCAAQAAANDTVYLQPDSTFTVTLESNPSTGYAWKAAVPAGGPVSLVSSETLRGGKNAPGIVGAPTMQVFKFKSSGSQKPATLTFNYLRPWEKDVPPAETYSLAIQPSKQTDAGVHNSAYYYLHVNGTFSMGLVANPSTGYAWQIGGDLNKKVLEVTRSYKATNPGLIGGGGTEKFSFKAIGAGSTSVLLRYGRADTPARTQYLGVTVAK